MNISKVKIHNFRSIKDIEVKLDKYSLLVGENNVGKTNLLAAIRVFYENGIKFDIKNDFPKFETDDQDSWVEIEFHTTEEEQNNLREAYQSEDNILKVRKYFRSDNNDLMKANQSNIYAYEKGKLSKNLFYGAKNISQARLGQIIYIPEISKMDETLKLSGPSPFRDLINFVMNKVIRNSPAFNMLEQKFEVFNKDFSEESSKDGFSLKNLIEDINEEIYNWDTKFNIDINPINSDILVKNLISYYIEDKNLDKQRVNISSYGQGMQRHLIYTLIKLSTKYVDKKEETRKEFSPNYILILFEEPEAFLHPSQQEYLNISLRSLANENDQQILITTHSPTFVSKNINELRNVVLIKKEGSRSMIYQLDDKDIDNILNENMSMCKMFSDMLTDESVPDQIKTKIINKKLGYEDLNEEAKLEDESIRYFLWLDSERACLFFAKHIIICEGASEKIFIDYLISEEWKELINKHIYFLDAIGKYNIHRYMNLFAKLGIPHSVLMDCDKDTDIQLYINEYIENSKNKLTKKIYSFEDDLEAFLGIPKPNSKRGDLKPLNVMKNYKNGSIPKEKIDELKQIIIDIL